MRRPSERAGGDAARSVSGRGTHRKQLQQRPPPDAVLSPCSTVPRRVSAQTPVLHRHPIGISASSLNLHHEGFQQAHAERAGGRPCHVRIASRAAEAPARSRPTTCPPPGTRAHRLARAFVKQTPASLPHPCTPRRPVPHAASTLLSSPHLYPAQTHHHHRHADGVAAVGDEVVQTHMGRPADAQKGAFARAWPWR